MLKLGLKEINLNILIPLVFNIFGEMDSVDGSVTGGSVTNVEVIGKEVEDVDWVLGVSAIGTRSESTGRIRRRNSILKYLRLKTRNKSLSLSSGNKYKIL